jgi:hypothetical protein
MNELAGGGMEQKVRFFIYISEKGKLLNNSGRSSYSISLYIFVLSGTH